MANGGKISPATEFKPGQSGNPKGRPKGIPNAATRMKRFLEMSMKTTNPVTKTAEKLTIAEIMDLQIIAKAIQGDLAAWEKINDRLEGKARQSNDISMSFPDGVKVEIANMGSIPIQSEDDLPTE